MGLLEDLQPVIALGYRLEPFADGRVLIAGHGAERILAPTVNPATVISLATDRANLHQILLDGQTYFANNYTNWGTLGAAAKDTAAKNGQRALATLIGFVLDSGFGGVQ